MRDRRWRGGCEEPPEVMLPNGHGGGARRRSLRFGHRPRPFKGLAPRETAKTQDPSKLGRHVGENSAAMLSEAKMLDALIEEGARPPRAGPWLSYDFEDELRDSASREREDPVELGLPDPEDSACLDDLTRIWLFNSLMPEMSSRRSSMRRLV
jgi:hypothetical protein